MEDVDSLSLRCVISLEGLGEWSLESPPCCNII